jgi:hypothetical protein
MAGKELWRKFRDDLASHGLWWAIGGDKLLDRLIDYVKRHIKAMIGTALVPLILSFLAKLWFALTWEHYFLVFFGLCAIVVFLWYVVMRRYMEAQSATLSAANRTASIAFTPPSPPAEAPHAEAEPVTPPPPEPIKIHTIDFEYMKDPQDSPLNHGWKWAEKDESTRVKFGVPHDAPAVGSLAIVPSVLNAYGVDYTLQQGWILADRLGY